MVRKPAKVAVLAIATLVAILAIAAILVKQARKAASRTLDGTVQNVLFIVIDTLRPDHLGCYGYPRATSPNIDRLAASAVRFERASTAWPETSESMAAMLSGTWCQTNGVVADAPQRIPAELDLLPEILQRAGFRTAAFVTNTVLARSFGFDQGSERYDEYFMGGSRPDGAFVERSVREWMEANRRNRFFAWVHFIEPHAPYEPKQPERFVGDPWYDASRRVEVRPADQPWRAVGGIPGCARIEGRDELAYYVARYDSEIVDVDARVGRLLTALADMRLDRRTLVVLVSDHGEGFGEHNYFSHGFVPFEENARVVMLLRAPGCAPGVVPDVVSTVDLAPTILDLLGLPPAPTHEGASLAPQLREPGRPTGRLAFTEAGFDKREWQRSVRDRRFKLVHVPSPGERRELRVDDWSLFDLESDPAESHDVIDEHADEFARLKSALFAWMRSEPLYHAAAAELTPEETETLRKLGYVRDGTAK